MKKLTLVRILTVFIVTSAVILSNSSTVQGTPLFFDFLKRTFGGKGKAPKPASNQRPQGSAWATGGQYQKEKKFPWDIFGIFGYKNVIRPNNRPRPQRPGPPYRPPRPPYRPTTTGRPPFFPGTTTWPNNCNCGWAISSSPTGGPVIVSNNNNAGVSGQELPPVLVIGKPPGVALPPPGAPVAPKPPPSVTLIQTVSNGTTTFNYTSFNDWNNNNNVRNQQNGGNNMVNLGGGILNFNPAQQYTPASEVLPGYQPGNRATLPAPAVFSSGTAPSVTTQPSNIIKEGDFAIEEVSEAEITTFLPSTLPRQNRNQDLDDQDLPQPEFGIDIAEEPAAEPINTHGDGWVPISINQVIKTISEEIDSKVELTTPKVPSSKRVPKVLKWFDNPYFIQKQPNLEALDNGNDDNDINNIIDEAKVNLDDNIGEKKVPQLRGVSISDNAPAFQRSVNNLATLAYATEAIDYTSTEDGVWSSRRSGKQILENTENDLIESSTESNLGIWRLIATPSATTDSAEGINENPLFYPSKAGLPNNPTTHATTATFPSIESNQIKKPSFFEQLIKAKLQKQTTEIPSQVSPLLKKVPAALFSFPTQSPVQLKKMVEKPLEVSNVDSKILQPNVEIFGPVTHDQLKKIIIDKPKMEVSNVDSKPNVGFFEPVTQDPIYNWIWADVQEENKDFDNYENFNQDDLRDPDMTTIGTGTSGIASAAILNPENENFQFPTLEPGFDLLSDDWFQVNVTETAIKENEVNDDAMMTKENLKAALEATTIMASTQASDKSKKREIDPEKFMLYYPVSGTPLYSFHPKLENASVVK